MSELSVAICQHERCVLSGYRGSVAHGMHVPRYKGGVDDVDYMAIFVATPEHYLGLTNYYHQLRRDFSGDGEKDGTTIIAGADDIVVYDIRKNKSINSVRLASPGEDIGIRMKDGKITARVLEIFKKILLKSGTKYENR